MVVCKSIDNIIIEIFPTVRYSSPLWEQQSLNYFAAWFSCISRTSHATRGELVSWGHRGMQVVGVAGISLVPDPSVLVAILRLFGGSGSSAVNTRCIPAGRCSCAIFFSNIYGVSRTDWRTHQNNRIRSRGPLAAIISAVRMVLCASWAYFPNTSYVPALSGLKDVCVNKEI